MARINKLLSALVITTSLFLFGCSQFISGSSVNLSLGSISEGIDNPLFDNPEPVTLGEKAMQIIATSCNSCHSSTSFAAGGFNTSDILEGMIADGFIVPGDSAQSRIYVRISQGTMPPSNPMLAEEIALVGQWIDEGATLEGDKVDETLIDLTKEMTSDIEILQAASKDLREQVSLGQDPLSIRYFSLAHLNDQVNSSAKIIEYQNSISKLVNSLSWNPLVKKPQKVDGSNVLFRIAISDYNWSLTQWQAVEAAYDFDISVNPGENNGANRIDENRVDFQEQLYLADLKNLTKGAVPILRGDWFVHKASSPTLYHTLMGTPQNLKTLETELTLDVSSSIFKYEPLRAAFVDSGVSNNNRMIERHKTPYGAYWKSYDFASSIDLQNTISRPLGPTINQNPFATEAQFAHDGGEVIFNLPNGLQSYALVDANDDRIEVAPTDIVEDFLRDDRVVNNGISCIACHAGGMNRKYDEVRDFAELNIDNFAPTDYDAILSMYQPKEILEASFDEDDKKFLDALTLLGIDGSQSEPVSFAYNEYEKDLTLSMIAHDLSLPEAELSERISRSRRLRRTFGPLTAEEGTISRSVYEENFRQLYNQLKD